MNGTCVAMSPSAFSNVVGVYAHMPRAVQAIDLIENSAGIARARQLAEHHCHMAAQMVSATVFQSRTHRLSIDKEHMLSMRSRCRCLQRSQRPHAGTYGGDALVGMATGVNAPYAVSADHVPPRATFGPHCSVTRGVSSHHATGA